MSGIEKNTGATWADHDPYRTIVDAAAELEQRGASTEVVMDALLSISLTWASSIFGPRLVSERLYALGAKFEAEADKADAATRGGAGGKVH